MGRKVKPDTGLHIFVAILVFFASDRTYAAFELDSPGGRGVAMGGAGVATNGDFWAVMRNPAAAYGSAQGLSITWSEQFELPELAREEAVGTFGIGSLGAAVHASNLGGELYREGQFGVAIAGRIRANLIAGAMVEGNWISIRDYSTGHAVAASFGAILEPFKSTQVGAVWRNAGSPRISGYQDRLHETLAIGIAAAPVPRSLLTFDIVQEERFKAEYRFGAEAEVMPRVRLRVGARAEPVRPSAGFEVIIGRWKVAYAADLHPVLGPSHLIELEIGLGQ